MGTAHAVGLSKTRTMKINIRNSEIRNSELAMPFPRNRRYQDALSMTQHSMVVCQTTCKEIRFREFMLVLDKHSLPMRRQRSPKFCLGMLPVVLRILATIFRTNPSP